MPADLINSIFHRRYLSLLLCFISLVNIVTAERSYTVIQGDTLYDIAQQANTDVATLQRLNQLSSTTIRIGQILTLPSDGSEILAGYPSSFRVYHLQVGDNIEQIAHTYGISSQSIHEVNPEHRFGYLPAGTAIRLPPSSGFMATIEGEQNLLSLAMEYGIAPVEIARANDLQSLSDIEAGQRIFVPLRSTPPLVQLESSNESRRQEREKENLEASTLLLVPNHTRRQAMSESERSRARRNQLLNQQKHLLREASSLLIHYEAPSLIFIYPLSQRSRVTSLYGWRYLEITGRRFHHGIDLAAPTGTAILASKAGEVSRAGWIGNYGYAVYIDHNDGTQTRYAHMSNVMVEQGHYVNQAEVIGHVGSTGLSTGPHLHFELRVNGYSVDPREYLDF